MRQLYVYLVAIFLFFLVILPGKARAEITPTAQVVQTGGCVQVESGLCIPTDVGAFVQKYYAWGLGMIGGLSILFIMWGGYMILTSKGNPVQLNNGKSYIGYAIIGLLLAIFGYAFVELIVVDILNLPGFS